MINEIEQKDFIEVYEKMQNKKALYKNKETKDFIEWKENFIEIIKQKILIEKQDQEKKQKEFLKKSFDKPISIQDKIKAKLFPELIPKRKIQFFPDINSNFCITYDSVDLDETWINPDSHTIHTLKKVMYFTEVEIGHIPIYWVFACLTESVGFIAKLPDDFDKMALPDKIPISLKRKGFNPKEIINLEGYTPYERYNALHSQSYKKFYDYMKSISKNAYLVLLMSNIITFAFTFIGFLFYIGTL